ncbi:hypothetical protein BVX98_05500 [bacterium F11]|nr:hypothetical protein BVX98_05500 [bacterium F11]
MNENTGFLIWDEVSRLSSIDPNYPDKGKHILSNIIINTSHNLGDYDNGWGFSKSADALAKLKIGQEGEDLIKYLVKGLKINNSHVPSSAIIMLGSLGSYSKPVVPKLIEKLNHSRSRQVTIHALGEIGPSANQAVPALEMTYSQTHEYLREKIIETLNKIGTKDALRTIEKLQAAD